MRFIDIHSHLNLSPLKENKEAVLARMRTAQVATIVVGADYNTSEEAVVIAENNPDIWATVGLHPIEHDRPGDKTDNDKEIFDYEKYKELALHPRVVAIGECGLDYFRDMRPETKEKQKDLFKKHIKLALEVNKPLMIHCRPSKGSMDAYEDLYDILVSDIRPVRMARPGGYPVSGRGMNKDKDNLRGNLHFFAGNVEIAKKFLELGFTFSFDGPITFSHDYDEVIKFLPLESVMVETDAPFAAPAPYRGKTNEPAYVVEIAKKISEIKDIDQEKVYQTLLKNSVKFFNLSRTPLDK
ncbi:MAG: Hydrolase, TatD family [Candidatus Nomurabacteria bacterium GW2011_GWB1_37_5]|uniref:Hydrolase, TatD family n=1 Tax=Candidatus Nomurabacteria bacterium GW2011_GWB1_37_5 TaxID=1618742 RepID=A0A0G0GWT5_9BACT|nr:MAG: Hydrolase, TatD family [Candidatus Nomurabacteria bacterium GW2011_GWB1_37_5]